MRKPYAFSFDTETMKLVEKQRKLCRPKMTRSSFIEKLIWEAAKNDGKEEGKILENRKLNLA